MPRPKACCRVAFSPAARYFKPQGIPLARLEGVDLAAGELEAFRLRHVEGLEQTAAAARMGVSQSTYQRILVAASAKIADALVGGKALRILKP